MLKDDYMEKPVLSPACGGGGASLRGGEDDEGNPVGWLRQSSQ